MRVLVTGGRDYNDRTVVFCALNKFDSTIGNITAIIHGDATGADYLAKCWAVAYDVKEIPEPVKKDEWRDLGRKAGPLRNQKMLDLYAPDCVVAFPGGRGTANMMRLAEEAGVPVYTVDTSNCSLMLKQKWTHPAKRQTIK